MGPRKILSASLACLAVSMALFASQRAAAAIKPARPAWKKTLRKRLSRLESRYPGQIGAFVKDLQSGESLSFHGDETWYFASGVKVPVAIALLKEVEAGRVSLEDQLPLHGTDFVDGAGETNHHEAESLLSVRYLLEQMLIYSDNTATDMLIHRIGLDRVNRLVQSESPRGFKPITTLADVRRLVYGELHPAAARLGSPELLLLHGTPDKLKPARFASLLHLPNAQLARLDWEGAFERYYAKHLNSGRLRAYGRLLERLVNGQLLRPESTQLLLGIMSRVETGKERIIAGLPKGYVFAHKTGTQHGRVCDFGVIWRQDDPQAKRIVVASCARRFRSRQEGEAALRELGKALSESGLLT